MARGRTTKGGSEASTGQASVDEPGPGLLITFRVGAADAAVASLRDVAGVKHLASTSDFRDRALDLTQVDDSDAIVFDSLGVAVAGAFPDQANAFASLAAGDTPVLRVEPEPVFYALGAELHGEGAAYLRGYRDAVEHLYQRLLDDQPSQSKAEGIAGRRDSEIATWGLQATGVIDSRYSGRRVRVAVLDTGFDLAHLDFRGRAVVSQSFVARQQVQDENGHGTHCIGTACGPRQPAGGRRYGIAYDAEIYVGKVLSNQGSSLGRSTLAGIEWALSNGCHIISMSLGGPVSRGQAYSEAFERAGRVALERGALIIAAAGNESRRSRGETAPVASPANCPSIMAVAAVDWHFGVADFSNDAINEDGRVDVAGPGVDIYSSAPDPAAPPQPPTFRHWAARHDVLSGTSMATPHVSGIAALWREAYPDLSAEGLWRRLIASARPLKAPVVSVGAGLVKSP